MTKEITKAIILQEIQNKLKLREFEPELFSFSERVVPIYNIEQHLVDEKIEYTMVSITSGPAGYAFFTVPEDERWLLNRYSIIFMGSGAYTVTGVYIERSKGGSVNTIYLDMKAGQSVSYTRDLPKSVALLPGDILYVYIDNYTSTQNLRLYIDYSMEKIR